jgi:hypothetical protein
MQSDAAILQKNSHVIFFWKLELILGYSNRDIKPVGE